MKIAVAGLGDVGLLLSFRFARSGFDRVFIAARWAGFDYDSAAKWASGIVDAGKARSGIPRRQGQVAE
jgi:hypothetical protein